MLLNMDVDALHAYTVMYIIYSVRYTCTVYSWVSLCKYAVNLSGGHNLNCIDVYAVLERANDRKLHIFATKDEANTYSEHLIHSHDDVPI